MKIPIFNSIYSSKKTIDSKELNLKILNDLDFRTINFKKFPSIRILKMLPNNSSLFETILVSINDKLVELFLNKRLNLLIFQKNE